MKKWCFFFHHVCLAVLSVHLKISIASRTVNLYSYEDAVSTLANLATVSQYEFQAVPSSTRMSWRFSSSCCFNHAQETSDDTILTSSYPLLDRSTGGLEKQLGNKFVDRALSTCTYCCNVTFDLGHVPRPHYQPVSRMYSKGSNRTYRLVLLKRDSFCSSSQVRHDNPSVNLQTVERKLGFRTLEIQFVVYTETWRVSVCVTVVVVSRASRPPTGNKGKYGWLARLP